MSDAPQPPAPMPYQPPPSPVVLEMDCGPCNARTLHQRRADGVMVCVPCRVRADVARGTQPLPPQAAKATGKSRPLIALAGVLACVAPFLPWLTLGAISRTGFDLLDADSMVIVVLGVLIALVGAQKSGGIGRTGAVIFGAVILLFVIHDGGQIHDRLREFEDSPLAGAGSVGVGVYVAGIGGGLAILGALADT